MTTTTPTAEPTQATAAQPAAPVAAAPAPTLSILALVFGLLAFLGVGFPAAVAAIVLGVLAWSREPGGRTMAVIGLVAAAIHLSAGFLFALVGLAFFVPLSGLFFALPFL